MKKIIIIFLLFTQLSSYSQLSVTPMPAFVRMGKGELVFKEPIGFLWVDENDSENNDYLNDGEDDFKKLLSKKYHFNKFVDGDTHSYGLPTEIFFCSSENNRTDGYYELEITNDNKIYIRGGTLGFFYAFETIKQLIHKNGKNQVVLPHCTIKDYPRFPYRGMHLDVARHFFPVSFIKKYIDYLSTYKFNTFHWHLTDDQGWRIEIKKYPLLTKIGSCRDQTLVGHYGTNKYDSTKYCGYYTQQQIREVVKYAASKNITVIPEIEMPGHAQAALTSYPYLGCTKGPYKVWETWGVSEDVYCAGNDSTYTFIENVLDEVMQLFPSKYIHIGGDECPKVRWKTCPVCQDRIKKEGLKDEHQLQSYFVQRIEKYLNKKGRKMIGWDEILEGGLAANATVMSWRGEDGGIAAAKQNHDVIMTPGSNCYLDHSQSKNEDSLTIGGYLPLENVYNYDPVPASLSENEAKHILGAQGNLWTEYITNPSKVEYMIFPRMIALSEVVWSPKEKKNWNDFERRLPGIFESLDKQKINYSKAYYDLKTTVLPTENNNGVYYRIESKNKGDSILFYDYPKNREECLLKEFGRIPDTVAIHYEEALPYQKNIRCSGNYGYWLIQRKVETGTKMQEFSFNKATGKKITLAVPASKNYPGDGAFTLVNGVWNTKGLERSSEFLGFLGTDLDATIDLGKETEISGVKLHSFTQTASWIYPAKDMIVLLSHDGINFTNAENAVNDKIDDRINKISFNKISVRYVKVVAKNFGLIPQGNPGAGNPAWLFVDEIEVE